MNDVNNLYMQYGQLVLQAESIQNQLMQIKQQIIQELNKPQKK